MPSAAPGYRAVFASRDLRRLFTGLVISSSGTWAYNVAILAWIYARTHSLTWVGVAGVVRLLPMMFLSVYAGVLAERTERIRLMVGSDLLCLVWQALLALVAAVRGPPVVALVFVALTAASASAYNPAVAATIPTLAGEDELAAANALSSSVDELVVIVGPAIGAVLLALTSATTVFAVNAVSFGVSAAIVTRIRTRSRPVDVTEGGQVGLLRQMAVGVRVIVAHAAARTLVAYSVLMAFVYGSDTVLFIDVSARRLGTGSTGWGYLLAGLGVGGLLAAGTVNRLSGSRRLGFIILAGALGYCLPTALLVVIHAPALAFVVEVVRGVATVVVDVLAVTALQRAVSPDELARVFGVYFALVIGAISIASLVTPVIVSGLGLDSALWIMALGPAALALLGLPALRAIDRATVDRADALAPLVAILESLDIFAAASRPVLERLATAARDARYDAGVSIITEGDPADALYVLTEGTVRVSSRGEAGVEERTIRTMTAPTYFGEIGLLGEIPRTATVTAERPCVCLRIDGDAFLETLTTSSASGSMLAGAQARLAVTHPSRRITAGPLAES